MKRPYWLGAGAVLAVLVVWLGLRTGGGEQTVVDLIAEFPKALQQRPFPESFSIVDATLGGQQMKAIQVQVTSRLVYSVQVPENAKFKVSLGLLEGAWTTPGDGVLFRVLLAPSNLNPEEILNMPIDPYGNPRDRKWHEVTLDLSEYAGETVELFLNTNSSPPVPPGRDDRAGDLAVWGAPRVVSE